MRRLSSVLSIGTVLGALSAGLVSLFHAPALAEDLSACGNIYVEGGAQCTVRPPSAECEVACTPINVEASCAADLRVSCDGQCNVNVDVGCAVDCSASCEADCNVNPGSFECTASCQASCGGDCEASCAAKPGSAHCEASCKASCSGSCDADCKVTPPSASCKAKCDASCKGSCHAKANADCQVDCQAKGYASCEANVTGGCEAACKTEKGALFCDGQFIDTNSVDQCAAALKSLLDIEVMYSAESSGQCSNGTCTGDASASAGCSLNPHTQDTTSGLLGFSLVGLAVVLSRRRRNG